MRVDGEIVRGCLMLAVQCDGATVETIEGLSDCGEIADLQDRLRTAQRAAMRLLHAGHAGGGAGFVETRRRAERASEIREHLSGNYCRCTGYHAIVDAVEAVAKANLARAKGS